MEARALAVAVLLSISGGLGCGSSSGGDAPADAGGSNDPDAATVADASVADGAVSDARPSGDAEAGLPGWVLAWSDEFDAPSGTAPDPAKWTLLTGGDGWGNQEREYYSTDLANASQQNGSLAITATKAGAAAHTCWYGACQYTSARLQTKGKMAQKYGRFEARIKVPQGQGMWPAWWMLGDDIDTAMWPGCGEIDVMENIGREPGTVHGSLHGPGYSGGNPLTGSYALTGGKKLGDDFHVYAVEWEASAIRFYLDDVLYETRTPADVPAGKKWVYDHPFFLLLNLAVGGQWPADPDGTTTFPQSMLVDYVRVYRRP